MLIKSKTKKHSIEEKLQAVELYQQGYGRTTISRKLSINETTIGYWLRLYNNKGLNGFIKSSKPIFTADFRLKVVQYYLDNSLSFEQVGLKFNISYSVIHRWVQKAKNHGFSSLSDIKYNGRPSKTMGRPKKKEPETELEKLQAELEYVLAENAYLKKLNALVEERIVRESSKKSKPSSY